MKFLKTIILFFSLLWAFSAFSQTHFVQNLNDSGVGSLRETILLANPSDTIRFSDSLLASGNDTIAIDSIITIDKDLVIKGLFNATDTLSLSVKSNKTMFVIDSVDNVVFDSLFFTMDTTNISSAWAPNPEWIRIVGSNLTLENSWFTNYNKNVLYFEYSSFKNSSFLIQNCNFNSTIAEANYATIVSVPSGVNQAEFIIRSTTIETNANYGLDLRAHGIKANNTLIIEDSYIKKSPILIFGHLQFNISKSTFLDSPIKLGETFHLGGIVDKDIHVNMENSTFAMDQTNNAITCLSVYELPQSADTFNFYLKNCTFNGGVYNTTIPQDYFGPHLDYLSLEGCIFNDISGFNTLPIDFSGGYNLFGFPQTIGLQSTDSQNVSIVDMDLGPLEDNGGYAPTFVPSQLSVAFNSGNPSDISDAQNGPIIQNRDRGAAEFRLVTHPTENISVCGDQYIWREDTYMASGNYSKLVYSTNNSFDTLFSLELNLDTLHAVATSQLVFLSANISGQNYQWLNCDTDSPINGAILEDFTPTNSGNYAVIIDNGNCVDTSACISFTSTIGLNDLDPNAISISLNEKILQFHNLQNRNSDYVIYNVLGYEITAGNISENEKNLKHLNQGLYFIKFSKDIKTIKFLLK